MRWPAAVLLLVATPALSARADEPPAMTSARLLELVEANSPAVAASRFREEAADAGIGIARSAYYPTLDFEVIDSTGFPGSSGLTGVGGLMGSPYRSGAGAGLVTRETLWDFGRTSNAVAAARQERELRREDTKVTSYQTRQTGLQAYYDCARFRSQRDAWILLSHESAVIADEVKGLVKTGQRTVVERYLVNAQTEEANTAAADFEERRKVVIHFLSILTGVKEEAIVCPAITSISNDEFAAPPASAYESSLVTRARADAGAARARLDQAKAGHLPRIVAVASLGELEKSRLVNKQDYAVAGALVFPLFDGLKTTHEVRRAEAAASEKERELEAATQRLGLINARYDQSIQSARIRLVHLESELTLAQEAFTLAKRRYFSFQGNLIDVREALRNLARTQTQINDAKAELLQAQGAKALVNDGR